MDLRTFAVKNSLILAGLITGIIMNSFLPDRSGLPDSMLGIIIPAALLFVLHILRMIGAADIKLISVSGAFLGLRGALFVTAASFLTGGVISLILMIKRRIFVKRLRYLAEYSTALLKTGRIVPYEDMEFREKEHLIHFSVPVLLGAVFCMAASIPEII